MTPFETSTYDQFAAALRDHNVTPREAEVAAQALLAAAVPPGEAGPTQVALCHDVAGYLRASSAAWERYGREAAQ